MSRVENFYRIAVTVSLAGVIYSAFVGHERTSPPPVTRPIPTLDTPTREFSGSFPGDGEPVIAPEAAPPQKAVNENPTQRSPEEKKEVSAPTTTIWDMYRLVHRSNPEKVAEIDSLHKRYEQLYLDSGLDIYLQTVAAELGLAVEEFEVSFNIAMVLADDQVGSTNLEGSVRYRFNFDITLPSTPEQETSDLKIVDVSADDHDHELIDLAFHFFDPSKVDEVAEEQRLDSAEKVGIDEVAFMQMMQILARLTDRFSDIGVERDMLFTIFSKLQRNRDNQAFESPDGNDTFIPEFRITPNLVVIFTSN